MVAEQGIRSEEFIHAYRYELRYVWKTLARLGAPPAFCEDLTHDVFATAYRQWSSYDSRRPLRPWLFGIAYRVYLDFIRKKQNHMEEARPAPDVADSRRSAEERVADAERLQLAETALQALELDRRTVFLLHELDGLTIPEVAAALDIPLNTAYSRLRLARRDFNLKVAELQRAGGRP
jgi:RNA polymerase sigma-70 factor (ECF subfamily)